MIVSYVFYLYVTKTNRGHILKRCNEQGSLVTDGDDMPLGLLSVFNRQEILWEGVAGCWLLVLYSSLRCAVFV